MAAKTPSARGGREETKRSFIDRYGAYIGFVSGALSLIIVFLGWFFWIDRRVQGLVSEKIGPYEIMLHAQSLARIDQYDDACGVYQDAFRQFRDQRTDHAVPTALIDGYLYAIANTDDPTRYSDEFYDIKKVLGEVSKATGWQLHEMGWYYFRTRDVKNARAHFQMALEHRKARHRYVQAAITHWSFALVSLVDGNMKEAMRHYREAEQRRPSEYAARRVVGRRSEYQNGIFWIRLRETYRDERFGDAFDKLLDQIEKEEQEKTQ